MKVYVARHGQDEDNANGLLNGHRNKSLTELGRKQAAELGRAWKDTGITVDAVFSSPLSRAFETAAIVAEIASLPEPVAHPLLIERDFGIMTGTPVSDIKLNHRGAFLKAEIITYFLDPENGETFDAVLKRVDTLLSELRKEYQNKSVAFFTHGDLGKMVYADFCRLPWQNVLKNFHFGNGELLLLEDGVHPDMTHIVKLEQHNH